MQAHAADSGSGPQRMDAQGDASAALTSGDVDPQRASSDAATPGEPAQAPPASATATMARAPSVTGPGPSVNTTAMSPMAAGASAAPAADGGMPGSTPRLPKAPASCPTLRSGMLRFGDIDVQLRAGTPIPGKPGPLLIYWHGTGSSPSEISGMLHDALDEIPNAGGVIAVPASTSGRGRPTLNDTWYEGDARCRSSSWTPNASTLRAAARVRCKRA